MLKDYRIFDQCPDDDEEYAAEQRAMSYQEEGKEGAAKSQARLQSAGDKPQKSAAVMNQDAYQVRESDGKSVNSLSKKSTQNLEKKSTEQYDKKSAKSRGVASGDAKSFKSDNMKSDKSAKRIQSAIQQGSTQKPRSRPASTKKQSPPRRHAPLAGKDSSQKSEKSPHQKSEKSLKSATG